MYGMEEMKVLWWNHVAHRSSIPDLLLLLLLLLHRVVVVPENCARPDQRGLRETRLRRYISTMAERGRGSMDMAEERHDWGEMGGTRE